MNAWGLSLAESLSWSVPLLYVASAALGSLTKSIGARWSFALYAAGAACVSGWAVVLFGITGALVGSKAPIGFDGLSATVLVLIATLGFVVVHYSRRYLEGEPRQTRFVAALLLTLAAVSSVVLTRNFAVLLIAWFASSVFLHDLLTFYKRPAAVMAARKKFIVSRIAEGCLIAAGVVLFLQTNTLDLDQMSARLSELSQSESGWPLSLHVAAVLIVIAVLLKSAQLPLHGWLIQVMEAPTPVSALLHAGVVNLGGFVLIRLSACWSYSSAARWLLIAVGVSTALAASLVMMTRISIKVRLAWSTCAQMGFMLIECALGWYALALLHLVGHSLYKAYAFLSAGDVVQLYRRDQALHVNKTSSTLAQPAIATVIGVSVAFLSAFVWHTVWATTDTPIAMIVCIGLALATLWPSGWAPRVMVTGVVAMALIAQLYFAWHTAFMFMSLPVAPASSNAAMAFMIFALIVLYVLQSQVLARRDAPWSQRLYRAAFAGFYLDEYFTRAVAIMWPRSELKGERA